MNTLEPPTGTMQANNLAPQGQPSGSRQTHASEEGEVTPEPLSWTDKLLCPHTQSQNNEFSRCTPYLLLYIMTSTRGRSQERDSKPLIAIVIQNLFNIANIF